MTPYWSLFCDAIITSNFATVFSNKSIVTVATIQWFTRYFSPQGSIQRVSENPVETGAWHGAPFCSWSDVNSVLQAGYRSTTASLERERAQKRPSNIGQLSVTRPPADDTLFFRGFLEEQRPAVSSSEERRKLFALCFYFLPTIR